jgi:hypothetical protein
MSLYSDEVRLSKTYYYTKTKMRKRKRRGRRKRSNGDDTALA